MREQHTRLLEEHRRCLEEVEAPLRVVNDELQEAFAKMYALKDENQLQMDSLRGRHESLLAAYTAAYSPATQPLTPDEYSQLLHSILLSKSPQGDAGLKFLSDVRKLVIGEFELAAGGFPEILGCDEDTLNVQVARGLPAMKEEVEAIGDPMLSMWWDYVVNQAASEQLFPIGVRDKGRAGIRIEGFAELDEAKIANLNIPELIALRLYSTPAFPFFNDPLRAIKDAPKPPKGEKRKNKKHPLAVIVMLLIRAIKKLRIVDASTDEATQRKILWRGMKNVEVTSEFEQKGGTELGAMSTTTDLDVAFNYCRSSRSLIFKIVTENKLQRGALVQWISAFPNESEVLFSPLTFMQATGKNQVVEMDGYHITIVEVRVTTA